MFTIIQEFTEKYCGFRGSLFSIHPLSGCERLPGVGCSLWSLGAAFLDYDRDGDLDLFVELGGATPGDQAYNDSPVFRRDFRWAARSHTP